MNRMSDDNPMSGFYMDSLYNNRINIKYSPPICRSKSQHFSYISVYLSSELEQFNFSVSRSAVPGNRRLFRFVGKTVVRTPFVIYYDVNLTAEAIIIIALEINIELSLANERKCIISDGWIRRMETRYTL